MAVNNVKNASSLPLPTGAQGAADASKSEKAEGARAERLAQKTAAANAYGKTAAAPLLRDAANVQISPQAKELSFARRVIDETPDVREDKIAHFKNLIDKGQYKPDAGRIADGMLGEAIKDELSKNPDIAFE